VEQETVVVVRKLACHQRMKRKRRGDMTLADQTGRGVKRRGRK
jgi:hypothetical protein